MSFSSLHYQTKKEHLKSKYPWEGQHIDINSHGVPVKGRTELEGQAGGSVDKLHLLDNFASGQPYLCLCV